MIKKIVSRISLFTLIVLIWTLLVYIICDHIIDISNYASIQEIMDTDISHVKDVSDEYLLMLGITDIKYPIKYQFVKFKQPILGTFHEWNNTYFINISVDIDTEETMRNTIIHETRHLIVRHLKNQNIIDLEKYTEEIASYENDYYSRLFVDAICLYKIQ